jgi:GrpB-like predicted nucleotidyltransferase (UPF0157 family)
VTEDDVRAVTLGELRPLTGRITLLDYDPAWPRLFAAEADRVRGALGYQALGLEHVGSTAVPSLAAKPTIDMLLTVADTADEPAYRPQLERAGYVLRIREPDWHQHRLFKGPGVDVNLHVFPLGCMEIMRMVRFRDWLRSNAEERTLYERTKRELVEQSWTYMQQYADAKSTVVEAIIARAR